MGLFDPLKVAVQKWLGIGITTDKASDSVEVVRSYRVGKQPRQIKVKVGSYDDNVYLNIIGLIIDRWVSLLIGSGVTFDFGDDETAKAYVDEVWAVNKGEWLMNQAVMLAVEAGTGYFKIIPNGITTRDGRPLPRIVAIDPTLIRIITAPDDMGYVKGYVIEYEIPTTVNGIVQTLYKREVTERNETGAWEVVQYEKVGDRGQWVETDRAVWGWAFPPILHWQNNPNPSSVYGEPDITDSVLILQDKINFVASNIAKIIRNQAHQRIWGKNIGTTEKVDWGVDQMFKFSGDGVGDAGIGAIDANGDLSASQQFLRLLRQFAFDMTRTVDIDSLQDKLGSLTNFGLRVLYQDCLAKLETKRGLFGDALEEMNYRLLAIANMAAEDGGEVVFPEALPQSETEEAAAITSDIANGLVSRQTASEKRGYVWADEQERIQAEAAATDNIGAALLQAFDRGE